VASAVNNPQSFDAPGRIELEGLNEAERRVLRMLAEGHTAKSIASTLDSTPAAVNERLREARRKTGAGSSRELARLLKAQENRHEQIGVGGNCPVGAVLSQSDAEPWRPQMGVIAMIALFLVAAAGAVSLINQSPSTTDDVDPLIGAPVPRFADPADWYAKVRSEARDGIWASRAEDQIRARVLQIPLIGKNGNVLRVTCATTICEIAGTVAAPASKREQEDQKSPSNVAIKDLQVPPLPDDLAKLGLKSEGGTFTGAKSKPDRIVFLVYYSRAEKK